MQWIYLLLALIAGIVTPIQAAMNNKLENYLHSPALSAFFSFVVGLVALFIYLIVSGVPLNQLSGLKNAPPLSWMGGLCGAIFVTGVVIVVPRLGIALTFSLIILGQMLITLPIDHFGFLDVPIKEINLPRILGILLVIIGVILIRRF